jgi:hypothetical protein
MLALRLLVDWQGNRNPFVDYPALASIYHGGPRPLLGDGLGYECTVPPPPPGSCSDDSGPCSSVEHCPCLSSAATRNLFSSSHLRGQSPSGRKLQPLSKLMITGVLDGPLPGGLPKMVELHALEDVADLSAYGIGSANNGGGTDGQEFTLSGSATAGSFVTIASEVDQFRNYFGEAPTYRSGVANINGDDAIELFFRGEIVDNFGDNAVDGTGEIWDYKDGWAYRNSGPNPGCAFRSRDWTFSGTNAVDGCIDNDSCRNSFPLQSFGVGTTSPPTPAPTVCACLI